MQKCNTQQHVGFTRMCMSISLWRRQFYRLLTQFGRKLIIEISMSIGHAMMKYIMYRLKLIKPIRVNNLQTHLHTYKHTYIHTYIHIYIHNTCTHMHAYIHTRCRAYLQTVIFICKMCLTSPVTFTTLTSHGYYN